MKSIRRFVAFSRHRNLMLLGFSYLVMCAADAPAQVRTKKPDRGVYRPPTMETSQSEPLPLPALVRAEHDLGLREAPKSKPKATRAAKQTPAKWGAPLVDTEMTDAQAALPTLRQTASVPELARTPEPLSDPQPVSERQPVSLPPPVLRSGNRSRATHLPPPHRPQRQPRDVIMTGGETWSESPEVYYEPSMHDVVHDGGYGDVACDAGCDSIASRYDCCGRNAFLSFAPGQWFGSAELLLMFRKGDVLPPLVTTSTNTNPDIAGELLQTDTQVIVGNSLFDDLTAGGRFTLGTWLDCQQCRSLTIRGWFAGQQSFHFGADQDTFPVLARPFLNVSDDQDPAQDTQLVAFPARASGAISVQGDSDVYGADVSVHQFCYGKYGGTVDVLYGYQYLGLDENLAINSTSTSLDDNFAPVGTVLTVSDAFDIENEFHGGQLGVATAYREGCWSFRGLLKIGFGSLRRSGNLFGQTTTSIDGATATDPNGLLVRSTNQGRQSDHTFAWSPEADLTLGWQRYPCFDLTFGYHIVALTDALELSGVIDPELAVNLSDPPVNAQRPTATFRYDTYYVQGIHFGLQYIY